VIEPLRQILRTQGRAHEHGIAKAMHICRGHLRDYREGEVCLANTTSWSGCRRLCVARRARRRRHAKWRYGCERTRFLAG
jgi:hypothetical protein